MLEHLTIYFPRGDGDSFLIRNISGKHDDRKVVVSLLESDELTAGLLWQKKNTLAGGSDAEVLVTYDSVRDTSDFKITLQKDDTESLSEDRYYLSLSSIDVSDEEDDVTLVTADLVLKSSGYGVFSGFDLPSEVTSFFQLDASDGEEFAIAQVALDGDGKKYMKMITLAELKSQLGIE